MTALETTTLPEPTWLLGVPACALIAQHEAQYGLAGKGGMWLCYDEASPFGPEASLMRLRVGGATETIRVTKPGSAGQYSLVGVAGQVLIQNGHAFWQLLSDCRWASRSQYTPVNLRGVPVEWS